MDDAYVSAQETKLPCDKHQTSMTKEHATHIQTSKTYEHESEIVFDITRRYLRGLVNQC